jgi:hypothetical protein
MWLGRAASSFPLQARRYLVSESTHFRIAILVQAPTRLLLQFISDELEKELSAQRVNKKRLRRLVYEAVGNVVGQFASVPPVM